MELAELYRLRAELTGKRKDLLSSTDPEDWTEEQQASFDDWGSQLERLGPKIQLAEQVEKESEALTVQRPRTTDPDPIESFTVNEHSQIRVGEPNILKDGKRGFRNLGDFSHSVYLAGLPGQMSDKRLYASGDLQSTLVGSDGGFMLPPSFSTQVWDGLNTAPNSLIAMCDTYTVEGESLTFNANAETSRANGYRYGGVSSQWLGEGQQITESKVTLRQVKVEPKELAAIIYCTDKLLRNAGVALEQYLTRAVTDELNFRIGDAIINGTGAGQPKGILAGTAGANSARVSVAKEGSQTADTVVLNNILKMWSRCHARARLSAVWFINQDVEPQLLNLQAEGTSSSTPVYLPPGGLSASPYSTILGRPVMPLEYCPTLGDEGDIILCDPRAYLVGLRGGIQSAVSMHLKFDYAKTAFRFIVEVDGTPWTSAPLTPYKGSNTVAPFVTVAERA